MNRTICGFCFVLFLASAGCESNTPGAHSNHSAAPLLPLPPPSPPPAQGVTCTPLNIVRTSDVDALPGGVWLGELIDCAHNVRHGYLTAMISEDGRFRIMAENEHLLVGVLQTDGDTFRGSGTDFAAAGSEYYSGPTTSLFVEGTIAERQAIRGRWGTEWGDYRYFSFDYVQESYERPTPLADLGGVWPTSRNYLGKPVEGVWTIEPDGRINGQDRLGCLQSGQFSLIDERYNILAVELTVTACSLAGTYSGLAQRDDLVDWWEKSIMISANDSTHALRIGMAIERP